MNEIHDCRECKKYGTDYDCRENCEGRDMFEPIKKKTKKLIIEIDEETYNAVIGDEWIDSEYIDNIINTIQNGTPLEEELEKIKAELEYMAETQTIVEDSVGMAYHKSRRRIILEYYALKIIDKRISELKGE